MDTSAILSDSAQAILRKMRRPASPLDRPGDWVDLGILRDFGKETVDELVRSGTFRDFGREAVDELVGAGLVQRGGTPSPVPEAIAAMYPDHIAAHRECLARTPVYPASQRFLFITEAGWSFPLAEPVENTAAGKQPPTVDASS